jgi:hypothetical protein
MAKLLKISGRIIGFILEWTLLFVTFFAFAIRTSSVQTYLAEKVTAFLSKELNTTLRIDKVSIVFIDQVALDGVFVLDQEQDTLASIGRIYVTLDNLDLDKPKVSLGKAELEHGIIHLKRDSLTGNYNYQFLADYFDSGTKTEKASKPVELALRELSVKDMDVRYNDNRKTWSDFGVDFDHIHLRKLSFLAKNIDIKDGNVEFDVEGLRAKERSGFVLSNLNTHALIGEEGLQFSKIRIQTPLSDIKAKRFALLFDDKEDLQFVNDSVTFVGDLQSSKVSLLDVSMFATALEGMDQKVTVSGKVSDKVKNLKIRDLNFSTGRKTILRGDLNLPDFRHFEQAIFSERIDFAHIDLKDLKKIKLPISSKERYLTFDKYLERLAYFRMRNVKLDGFYSQFVIAADKVQTAAGSIRLDNGIMFEHNPKNKSYFFERSEASTYDVKVENFDLGKFLADKNFGLVDGTFFLSGEFFSVGDIRFTNMEGDVNRFDYLGYSYNDIKIREGSFEDQVFTARIDVKDDNLDLVYDGYIDFKGQQHLNFSIDLKEALLEKLHLSKGKDALLKSNFRVNLFGMDPDKMFGSIVLEGIFYQEGGREIQLPELTINVTRGKENDMFIVNSEELGRFELIGKVEFATVVSDFMHQFDKVFPGLINDPSVFKEKKESNSRFTYDFITRNTDDFLAIFAPDLKIKPGTVLKGSYDSKTEDFQMLLTSGMIKYGDFMFKGVEIDQELSSNSIVADYYIDEFQYGDSIKFQEVFFTTAGQNNILNSNLIWNPNSPNAANIRWETIIVDNTQLLLQLEPSYFAINETRWDVEKSSDVSITTTDIHIAKFKLSRGKQFIAIDGCISRNDSDKLNFRVNDLDLREMGSMFGLTTEMDGLVNGWGYLSNPYTNLTYMGDASILGLYVNNEEVGDVFVQSQWNRASESVGMTGDLMYRGNQTFEFQGSYFTERERDNLDFYLLFDETDIQFANAFMDPDVISNIRGQLNGNLKVHGTPEFPMLDGRVNLQGGNAKIEMLGVNFGFDGQVIADEYGFYINNMPVSDEEGNTGSLIASVYHQEYTDWNFDVQVDLEGSDENTSFYTWAPANKAPDRFLVMNTPHKEGDYYYGKAYGTGSVNIFGYADNLQITVDMKTKRGTKINFPMYGVDELEEESSFVQFKQKDSTISFVKPAIDFTGVELNMLFRVTPDAKMKIIFNEQLGDEITAEGSGDISMTLDNLGDMRLDGTYKVKEGVYNFAMGPIKQPFFIQEGGTITWTGDPYNATLNLGTYYKANASLAEISPNELHGTANVNNQEVLCYLNLTESLMKPSIGFNIAAPKANETGKALISRINGDPDELNRQFFSLLLWKRFQPLRGSTAAGGSAALDLVSNQINSMLAMVSKDYKMNVNLDADNVTGENSLEFGVTKGFLDDRLIVTGSFGVERNVPTANQNQSMLIGDVSVEYLLNESGSFRVSIFNESNDYSVIQDKNLGLFTQGAGIQYHEDFDNAEDFLLLQYMLDIFRKKENKKITIKRKKKQSPVPIESNSGNKAVLPDNKTKP